MIKKETANSESNFKRMIMPGKSLRVYYGKGNLNNELLHIRTVVDGDKVVTRAWLKRKKRWNYKVDSLYYLEMLYNAGNLTKAWR